MPGEGRAGAGSSASLCACSALHRGTGSPWILTLLGQHHLPFSPQHRRAAGRAGTSRGRSASGLQLCWSRRAPAQLKGGQWLQSSGLEGWGRLGPAWKLSSLQGGGQRGGGASPQSCTALTLEQDPDTADQSRSAEPGSTRLPQACYIQIYTCLTVYYI